MPGLYIIYAQRIVDDLREGNRDNVKFYAELIAGAAVTQNDENLDFIFENIIKKSTIPFDSVQRSEKTTILEKF